MSIAKMLLNIVNYVDTQISSKTVKFICESILSKVFKSHIFQFRGFL